MRRQQGRAGIEQRLQSLLRPSTRVDVLAQLAALTAMLFSLSALASVVLIRLVRWLGPWWQQGR